MRQWLAGTAKEGVKREEGGCAAVQGVLARRGKGHLTNMLYVFVNKQDRKLQQHAYLAIQVQKQDRKWVQQFSWMNALLLAFLVSAASCLTTYSYPYFTAARGADIRAIVELANLTNGDAFTFEYNFFHQTGYTPIQYRIDLANTAFMSVAAGKPGFGSTTNIPFNSNLSLSLTSDIPEYFLMNGAGDFIASLQMFYLTITKNGATVTKLVDILRGFESFKLIYLDATKDITIDLTSGSFSLKSIATDPTNFKLDSTIGASSTSGTTKTFTALPAGYYAIQISVSSAGTLSYQSDPYLCPYDTATYSDPYRAFEACTTSLPSSSASQSPSEGLVAWQIAIIVVGVVLGVVVIVIIVLLVAKSSAASASTAGTVVPDSSGIVEPVKPSNSAGIGLPVKE